MNRTITLMGALLFVVGCGSSPAPTQTTVAHARPRTEPAATEPAAPEAAPAPRMAFSGLTGSLTTRDAHAALDPRMGEFAACFHAHSSGSRVAGLGGQVRLHIIVATDGHVRAAYPEDSTVGHRDVERCHVEVAEATRFPRPRGGGEATLTWPIAMDPPTDVRHPRTWDASRVARLIERNGADVLSQCRPEGAARIQVTAYTRRGRVIAAGAATDDESGRDALDCVVERVRTWTMPATARTAKVTFDLG